MPTIQVPLTRILPNPWQTRQAINQEHITALADDIQANDLLQKPSGRLVDPDEHIGLTLPDLYAFDNWPALDADFPGIMVQLEFGHNRFEAFKILAARGAVWASMPVDIRPLTNEQMADHAWSENERRRDHTPIERALAIQQRMNDFGWTQAQVAEHLQISRPVVGNSLRLLKLPEDVQQALASGNISERIAMALVSLFALPEALRQKAESGYDGHRPSIIVRQALEGSVSSDAIRERVESICRNVGRKLEDAGWSLDDVFAIENVTAPTCRDCDKRLEERNLCLLPQCYDLKALEAKRLYL